VAEAKSKSYVTSAGFRTFVAVMEVLILIVITLVAILIILDFRNMLADEAVDSFEKCHELYGNVAGDPDKCVTQNGDTYELTP
jgi:hypothetical protein